MVFKTLVQEKGHLSPKLTLILQH